MYEVKVSGRYLIIFIFGTKETPDLYIIKLNKAAAPHCIM